MRIGVVARTVRISAVCADTVHIVVLTGCGNSGNLCLAAFAISGAFTVIYASGSLSDRSVFKEVICYVILFAANTFMPVRVVVRAPIRREGMVNRTCFYGLFIGISCILVNDGCGVGSFNVITASQALNVGFDRSVKGQHVFLVVFASEF